MEAKAYLRNVRISPRKVQIVLNLIRGKDVKVAQAILEQTPKSASEYLLKLLKSAVANADHTFNMDVNNLYVAECFVQRQRKSDSEEDFAYHPFLERKGIS